MEVQVTRKANEKNEICLNQNLNNNFNNFNPTLINFLTIPWNDVIFPFIFPKLSWQDLFRLRRVSKTMKLMISEYLKSIWKIDLSLICSRFTLPAFEIITQDKNNLRILNLSSCKWLTNDHLLFLIERNHNLISLNVSNCFEVTNQCLEKLATCCKNLKSIILKECHWVNGSSIIYLSNNCRNLEDIDLTSCWEIADDSAVEIISKCLFLRRLSLSKIYGITDHVLLALATYSKNLEYLNISGCWRVTDYGIRMAGEYCSQLKQLVVGDCRDVSESSLRYLRNKGIKVDKPLPSRQEIISFCNRGMIRLQI